LKVKAFPNTRLGLNSSAAKNKTKTAHISEINGKKASFAREQT